MTDVQIIKVDEGGVNARILAKEAKADFRRIEAASVKMPARFTSAEGKRLFVRVFNTLQLNSHFISVIARTKLDHADVAKVEAALRAQIEELAETLNKAIDGAEALFKAHAITSAATYDTVPLDVQVGVLSSSGRRFLEVLGKFDQVMPLLQTLEIHEVIDAQAVDIQRAKLKRQVRNVANGARALASGLKRRMQALQSADKLQVDDGVVSPMGSLPLPEVLEGYPGTDEVAGTIDVANTSPESTTSEPEGLVDEMPPETARLDVAVAEAETSET